VPHIDLSPRRSIPPKRAFIASAANEIRMRHLTQPRSRNRFHVIQRNESSQIIRRSTRAWRVQW
jgi:hypothetical protein